MTHAVMFLAGHAGHQRVSCDVAPWYNGLGMALKIGIHKEHGTSVTYAANRVGGHITLLGPIYKVRDGLEGVKPLVTTNEQPSVEATHKDEAPVVILTRAFRGVDKATLAFGKAHCKVSWTNEGLLENKELNAIIGAWFTLWRD
ncbi:hypothetical protein Tco_0373905 [Tanacetum coccineum]